MRPFTQTIPFEDALRLVLDAAAPIERTEGIAIDDSDGRVVARDVTASVDVPPFDRAGMDGYAVIAADTAEAARETPITLTNVGRAFGGQTPSRAVARGECFEVATGAPMPAGADAVVIVEHTSRDADSVRIFAPIQDRQNVGRRGADIARGHVVVGAGEVMTPAKVGAIAALGATTVEVFARPSVAIASTGEEVVAPGRPLGPGQIYDINRSTVAAVVRRHGGVAAPLAVVGDSIEQLSAALAAARTHDVVVFSGGSSVGDRDLMVDAIRAHGEVIFHGIAVKPGKPTVFGRIGRTPVFGMPGYPASCLSSAYTLLLPLVRAVARLPPWRPRTVAVPLSRRIASTADRRQFYTVRVVDGRAEPAFKASGDITSLARADGYIEIPEGTAIVEAGEIVTVTYF